MKTAIKVAVVAVTLVTFAFTIHAQSTSRVFMLITASVEPGHMAEYQNMVEKQVFPIFEKQGVEVIGAFNSGLGGSSNEMLLLVAYKDFAHVQRALADPGITSLQANQFEKMRVLNTRLLTGTSFSPLK